jgi:ElaB/YqjD/DUF883 family membrane-anchored ribosome-binding protein
MNTHTAPAIDPTNSISHRTTSDSRSAAEAIPALGPELSSKFRRAVDASKTRASEWTGSLQNGIRHDPIRSVLIAATAGAVLGLVLGRRTR